MVPLTSQDMLAELILAPKISSTDSDAIRYIQMSGWLFIQKPFASLEGCDASVTRHFASFCTLCLTLFLCHESKGTFQWTKVLWGDGGTLIEVANATCSNCSACSVQYSTGCHQANTHQYPLVRSRQ